MDDKTSVYSLEIYLLLGTLLLIAFLFFISALNNDTSASTFISKCNIMHGDGRWEIHKMSEYITYANDLFETYPIIYMYSDDVFMPSASYTCFKNR